jgi:hypothetical protein
MKISGFKRIIKEDFEKEQQQLIDKIGYSINPFAEEVIRALSGNLNQDNLNEKLKSIDLIVNASGIPTTEIQFKNPILNTKVEGLLVIKAENISNTSAYPTGGIFITYSENANVITVDHITGLPAGVKFRLKLKVVGS